VFTSTPTNGNGLAVVLDGDGLSDETMQTFSAWTNLAETTFLLPPTTTEADYKVRIFTPSREMPFAGHPTLGSCASWLHAGGQPQTPGVVRQECGVGIIDIDITGTVPAFAAPKTTVAPLPPEKIQAITSALSLSHDRILQTAELANGGLAGAGAFERGGCAGGGLRQNKISGIFRRRPDRCAPAGFGMPVRDPHARALERHERRPDHRLP
jgi:PhzF family phenazine biosynthesis protein